MSLKYLIFMSYLIHALSRRVRVWRRVSAVVSSSFLSSIGYFSCFDPSALTDPGPILSNRLEAAVPVQGSGAVDLHAAAPPITAHRPASRIGCILAYSWAEVSVWDQPVAYASQGFRVPRRLKACQTVWSWPCEVVHPAMVQYGKQRRRAGQIGILAMPAEVLVQQCPSYSCRIGRGSEVALSLAGIRVQRP